MGPSYVLHTAQKGRPAKALHTAQLDAPVTMIGSLLAPLAVVLSTRRRRVQFRELRRDPVVTSSSAMSRSLTLLCWEACASKVKTTSSVTLNRSMRIPLTWSMTDRVVIDGVRAALGASGMSPESADFWIGGWNIPTNEAAVARFRENPSREILATDS